ncbi:hypothetical protein [Mycobacteroides abscessus]|uniref:hypothetical protein n=1 Tax=Mycobacteroides abscessus TaxID=36809 RepID=UPI0009A7CC72|nr:hypothetical protein [Mycobacteroides abscessus]SKO15590.1 Uncharacterised protein [Mycobacteroides abscessus subsp. bolletii]SKX37266.1 Uncharacterised protein [Mycobacteroides abscessus subsp. bolletii]
MTSPEIRQIVDQVYSQHLELPQDWTLSRRIEFLDQEAARISRLVAETAAQMSQQAIEQWARGHGMQPDYLTHVGLLNSSTSSAKELVLQQELYCQIPEPPEEESEGDDRVAPPRVPVDQRWSSTRFAIDPSPELEALVERVWPEPDFSVMFQIKAGYLLAAREAQGQVQPQVPDDPLAGQLAQLVYDDLRRDGLPEH